MTNARTFLLGLAGYLITALALLGHRAIAHASLLACQEKRMELASDMSQISER